MAIDMNKFFRTSKDVVAKEIEGELVIIPLKSGLGDLDAEMYALSDTGIAVWKRLDGKLTLDEVAKTLSIEYNASYDEVREDVTDLVTELMEKKLVFEISPTDHG